MNDQFIDLAKLDKKIPENLVMKYQGKPYALKAGLEFKAHLLYKGGNWGVKTEVIERTKDYVLAKAEFLHMGEVLFSNYGEASKENTNSMMHKYLLHMAVTRAECRVLRMATASAYASAEEMDWFGNGSTKQLPESDTDDKPVTEAQIKYIKQLGGKVTKDMNQKEAKVLVDSLLQEKK